MTTTGTQPVQSTASSLRRRRLLRSPAAHIIMLIAPAGYGKSAAASELREEYANSAVCDCSAASNVNTFSHSVIAALAEENPEQADFFQQLADELSRAQTESQCSAITERAWARTPPQSVFIFENAEAIVSDPAITSEIIALLNTTPHERRVLICSRVPLPVRASRYIPPHRLAVLTTADFVLDDAEAAEVLQREEVDPADWERIIPVARGWPIILLLLARLSREGRLDRALSDGKDVAFGDLFEYFVYEVLTPLDEPVKQVLRVCAAVPNVTREELMEATGQNALELESTVRKALLIVREGECYTVHSLLRDVLLKGDRDWPAVVTRMANSAMTRGDYLRACKLYRTANDNESAARALSCLAWQDVQGNEAAYEMMSLPIEALRKYPKLLAVAEPYRSGITPQLLEDAFNDLTEEDEPELVVAVAEVYSDNSLTLSDAQTILHHPLVRRAVELSPTAQALFAGWEQTLAVFFGAAKSAENDLLTAYELASSWRLPLQMTRIADYLARVTRMRGDWDATLHWRSLAISHSRKCGLREHASQLAFAMFDLWISGRDAQYAQYYSELEEMATVAPHPDYEWLLRALDPATIDSALPLWTRSLGARIAIIAAAKVDPEHSARLLQFAEQQLDEVRAPQFPVLLARAASDPARRPEYCRRILDIADENELPEFCAAVRGMATGESTFLNSLIQRFQKVSASGPDVHVRFEAMRKRVLDGERVISLTNREAALLTFLSRRRTATSREEIQDALWADLEERGARDSLYSLLHRLRKRTGLPDLVEAIGNAYRLGTGVQVDLWDLEFAAQKIQREPSAALYKEARQLYDHAARRTNADFADSEWFFPIEFRIQENLRALVRFLIGEAQKKREYDEVIALTKRLLIEDPADEWSNETLLAAYVDAGNIDQAKAAFKAYRTALGPEAPTSRASQMRSLEKRLRELQPVEARR